MMIRYFLYTNILILLVLSITGCFRGQPSKKPPIHLVHDMDEQPKYKPQSEGVFFEDSSAMRTPVPGTVAQGWLMDDIGFYTGMDSVTGKPLHKSPVEINLTGLQRGQERYNIYCSPCHSRIGDGRGIMVQRGYVPPPSFHDDLIRNYPDGHIFDVISNGIRNMPGYAQQISEEDRWLIVNYLRALQRSQNASIDDIPVELRDKLN
jgi:mono/diheme cytochrome c family protein